MQKTDMYHKCIEKTGCWHRQSGYMNDVCDLNSLLIYARVLESGQAAVVAAGVGAVVAHNLPSARQQKQEQGGELSADPPWFCVPAPALLRSSPIKLQNSIFPVLPRGLKPALGIFLSNFKEKNIEAAKLSVSVKAHTLFFSWLYCTIRFL